MAINPPRSSPDGAQDPAGPDHGATGASNLTAHLNDPAMRRSPPGKTPGADDEAAAEGAHSDRSPLADAQSTPRDEETRRLLDAGQADLRARHNLHAERDAVLADRAITKERQERESPDR